MNAITETTLLDPQNQPPVLIKGGDYVTLVGYKGYVLKGGKHSKLLGDHACLMYATQSAVMVGGDDCDVMGEEDCTVIVGERSRVTIGRGSLITAGLGTIVRGVGPSVEGSAFNTDYRVRARIGTDLEPNTLYRLTDSDTFVRVGNVKVSQ